MSISLIVLRLEVADETENLPDFSYTAPNFVLPSEDHKKSYAEAVERHKPDKSLLQTHKGRREYQPLTIETFTTEEVEMEEDGDGELELSSAASRACRMETDRQTDRHTRLLSTSPHSSCSSGRETPDVTKHTETEGAASSGESKKLKRRSGGSVKLRDRVSVESEEGACSTSTSRPSSGKVKVKGSTIMTTVRFFSGNPAVENTEGIIHLYKNDSLTPRTEDVTRSEMICMLTVPASMTSQDLLLFMGPVEPWVENIKIIRNSTPNQYMVLLKFKSQKYADDFYKNYNGISFNSLESDVCHLAYVAKMETLKDSEGASLPVPGLTELPVCPVCLERMDESVDGVLTVLCNHSFHGSCLAQWGDTSCPVCRYMQTPEPVPDNKCFHCESPHNLWICLICGHVGCGRYEDGHASSHFQETNHTYSMHLESNRVWDYAGDNFVHRLVQNKGDGKLVEVDEGGNRMEDNEKLDSITLEYTYLLTSQLEAQRHHFEEKIERVEKEAFNRVEEMEARSKKTLAEFTKLEHHLTTLQKDKQSTDRKCSQMNSKLQKLATALTDEQEMNKYLRENQAQWQSKVTEVEKSMDSKDKELEDLQDQLRDLMFYLEAQQKLSQTTAATQEEIQGGQIVVQGGATGGATGTKRGRKKGGR